ncbi:MAG: hypothetical protein GX751_06040 [Desulfuromonadaceae bacterium]|nr:hypothetical protein [Desulfuromonadaceae bacterium]
MNLREKAKVCKEALARIGDKVLEAKNFPVRDDLINKILEKNLSRLGKTAGAELKQLAIKSFYGGVNVSGKVFNRGVTVNFAVKAVALEPAWEEGRHRVRFKVEEKTMVIDKSDIRGVFASLGNRFFSIVTGQDFLEMKLRQLSDKNGVVEFSLDGLDSWLDTALKFLELTKIAPEEGRVVVTGKFNAKNINISSTYGAGKTMFSSLQVALRK